MKQKVSIFPIFLATLAVSLLILFIGRFGFLSFLEGSVQETFFPLDTFIFSTIYHSTVQPNQLDLLKMENNQLQQKIAQMQTLKDDNLALRDQFQTPNPPARYLLPARVVGMPGVIPNVSFPETIIIDRGSVDNVRRGETVVVENMIVGQVATVTMHFAIVDLISAHNSSFAVRIPATGAIGVARGQGNGGIILDDVVLSDTLRENDNVVTQGSQDVLGSGYPANLLVGKIVGIDKNPSSLFQTARIMPLLQFDRLTTVFLLNK